MQRKLHMSIMGAMKLYLELETHAFLGKENTMVNLHLFLHCLL